jgi:hypothetical protein
VRRSLIRLLGGFSPEDFNENCEVFRKAVNGELAAQREFFYKVLENKDEEIKRLTNLMLQEHGIIPREGFTESPGRTLQPLNKRVPWKERQEQLQKDAAKQQADLVKKQWEEKNAKSGTS